MAHLLSPVACPQARALFDATLHLAVLSAFAGSAPAELYVDDPTLPHAGLLIIGDHRFYLAGMPDDETFAQSLAALMRERYAPQAPGEPPFECALAYTPTAWEARLGELFGDIHAWRVERQYFELALRAPIQVSAPPEGFFLRRIDEALLGETALVNHTALVDEIHSEASSVDDFLHNKFGYVLQHGDELVAWCLSEYNHQSSCELGIETMSPFRRRGLATVVARVMIAHAQSAGFTVVGWHCWRSNVASSNLALALGFTHVADYPVWLCRFDDVSAT